MNAALPVAMLLALAPVPLRAADVVTRPVDVVIDEYVRQGLASNLTLSNRSLEADRALASLREGRARFFPNVSLNARYTVTDGGREIDVPVSQLLNPAYATLNELLVAQGSAPRFPPISDQGFPLLREREQDTHIALRQPLYAPGLGSSVVAARSAADAAELSRQAFARELQRDITRAYLDTLKSQSSAAIVASAVGLLEENLRINESLRANGKLTQDAVLRARAELLAARQQQLEAANGVTQSRSYFNFLLNRALDAPIEVASLEAGAMPATGAVASTLESATSRALQSRPELQQLDSGTQAAEAQLRAARARRLPSLSLGIDAGTQGVDYGFGRNYNYVTGSLLLGWTLFDGGERSASIARARLATRQAQNLREQGRAQIALQVQQAYDGVRVAGESLATAQARHEAAQAAFRIASRKRDEGVTSQVEFLDARNTLTGAELNLNWTRFELLQRQADLAFATAAQPLPLLETPP